MEASELPITKRAPRVRRAHGARALEGLLLEDLRAHARQAGGPRPLWIVTPSESARLHLTASCARAVGGTLLGVRVLSLTGAAAELLARTQDAVFTGASAFELFVRRRARAETRLRAELEHLDHGWRAVARSVRDLVDAGFDATHFDALVRALADENDDTGAQVRAHERARALLRVARAALRDTAEHGILGAGAALTQAARALTREPASLRAAEVWICGCGTARGSERTWIEALVAARPATVYFDLIEAPASTVVGDADVHPHLLRANGREAEVRACAARVQELCAQGVAPERVLVVARELAPYATAIRLHFGRLSIPFSGLSAAGSPAPAQRRMSALIDVLRASTELPVERWLDARAPIERAHAAIGAETGGGVPRLRDLDLLLACRALGAVRLRELDALDWRALLGERQEYALPLGRGARPDGEVAEDDGGEEVDDVDVEETPGKNESRHAQQRRTVEKRSFEREQVDARALCGALRRWPERDRLDAHAQRLLELAGDELGWRRVPPAQRLLVLVLAELAREVPSMLELTRLEFVELVQHAFAGHGASALGGNGGGVQCLSADESAARTAEHLFVLGLNQGVFPAIAPADPLLGDGVRRKLAVVLPELELRGAAFARERRLFEGLLRAGEHVTLSWLALDEQGKPQAPSSFLTRFLEQTAEVPLAPPALAPALAGGAAHANAARTPRPAHEHAVLAALAGLRADFARALPYALAQPGLRACATPAASAELARVRCAILDEIDAPWSDAPRLGPYFGFVGALASKRDARHADSYVTTLEALARCAWQCHLTRFLKLAPTPDPLGELPSFDARMIGNTVHDVLQELVRASGAGPGTALADVLQRAPLRMRWPAEAELDALLRERAREVLQAEGIVMPGLVRALANQARAYVDEARALEDADDELSGVLGAEINGHADLIDEHGATRRLRFRADRVDRSPSGPVLIDYKTGKPISDAGKPATRREHFEHAIARGKQLQAALYVLAAGAQARGRYLFLGPGLAADARCFEIGADTPELQTAFAQAARVLLRALDGGGFLPRLFEGPSKQEPAACGYCDVRHACNRGDSGARGRLERWIDARSGGAHERDSPAERQALELWNIGRDAGGEAASAESAT